MTKPAPAQAVAIQDQLTGMPLGFLGSDAMIMNRAATPNDLNLDARIFAAKEYVLTTGISAEMWLRRFGDQEVYEALKPEYGEPEPIDPRELGEWDGFRYTPFVEPEEESDVIDDDFYDFLDISSGYDDPYEYGLGSDPLCLGLYDN